MRIFQGCVEAIKEIERDLFEMGTEVHPESMQDIITKGNDDFKTKELMGYTYCILSGADKDQMLEYMKLPLAYAVQEHEDRITICDKAINPGNSYLLREDVWSKFLRNGKFSYTYNERLNAGNQLRRIIKELRAHPNSRQGIIQIWDYELDIDRLGGASRVPCSLMYQFIIREGELHLHYFQRSGDLLTHLPYDIWFGLAMVEHVARQVNVRPGRLHHYVTSLHAYHKDLKVRGIF